jgi:hypothetical protein
MKIVETYSGRQFLSFCEKNSYDDVATHFVNSFINSMKLLNPNMPMSRADWLDYFLDNYSVQVLENMSMVLVPNKGKADVEVFLPYE